MICCTASRRVEGAEASENGYIQGAGDDNEAWACGLTPHIFWQHRHHLMSTVERELPGLIRSLLDVDQNSAKGSAAVPLDTARTISISTLGSAVLRDFDGVIICSNQENILESEAIKSPKDVLNLQCGTGKLGSRALRRKLPLVPTFVSALIARKQTPKILVICPTGTDLAIGIALVLLCLYFDDDRKP